MSLATTSGMSGAGGGGLTMAHSAHAMGQPAAKLHRPPSGTASGTTAAGPLVGADLSNKHQSISSKQAKNLAHLPVVSVDLHATEPCVAYFPPKPADPSQGTAAPVMVGKLKTADVHLKGQSEVSHKIFRKYLAKTKSFEVFSKECLVNSNDVDVVVLSRPAAWLGVRRFPDTSSNSSSSSSSKPSHAIDTESHTGVGAVLVNGTLDGTSEPVGDDFDRVLWKVRLVDHKKAVPVLPEEAVQVLLNHARMHVAKKVKASEELLGQVHDFPVAIALPAWAMHDAAVEALLEATGSAGVIVSRNIAAAVGALLPPVDGSKPSALLQRVLQVRHASRQEFQKTELIHNPDAVWNDEVTLVVVGMTADGVESMALQISTENLQNVSALFADYKVLANVSYKTQDDDTSSSSSSAMDLLLHKCLTELEAQVERIAPEADGPAGIVFYGTTTHQTSLSKAYAAYTTKSSEWKDVPVFTTKPESVAMGAAVLGGVSHGRSTRVVDRATELALQVQDVALTAVGVQLCYEYNSSTAAPSKTTTTQWEKVKTIFDFDRRVPAGPFSLDLSAAECVVRRSQREWTDEELLVKAIHEKEGSKFIPNREEAAKQLAVQVVQKTQRDGPWMPVGDVMHPLVKTDVEDESKREACERVALELSLGVSGMISSCLVGDRQSVVQATKSARTQFYRFYGGVLLAVAVLGGFMVRSYREEYVFRRDVDRLMAYYRHVIPGSLADGDMRNAQYLVYKYRNKKERLWKLLEKKYGEPVLETHEWPDDEDATQSAASSSDGDDHDVDLDEGDETEEEGSREKDEL